MSETHPPASTDLVAEVRRLLESFGEIPPDEPTAFERRVEELAEGAPPGHSPAAWAAARLLSHAIKETRFALNERVLELESLYDLGLAVSGTLDIDLLADEILFRSISLTDSRSGALHLIEDGRPILSRAFGGMHLSSDAAIRMDLAAEGVLNTRAGSEPTCGVRLFGCEKCLVVPIQTGNRRLGVLAVADKETRDGHIADFGEADARLLHLFANQAATALETARMHREAIEKERLEKELELAATIQREILPKDLPDVPGAQVSAITRPTRQVGGDYFDVFSLPNGEVAFVVADVSGKGVPAALLVSTLASAIRLQIDDAPDPAELIRRVHQHLYRFSPARKFATMFFARFDHRSGELSYVSAGHNPAVVVRRDGSVEMLNATGHPVGMFPQSRWDVGRIRLLPGDRLCIYTDGITEAQSPAQEDFGLDRLRAHLVSSAGLPISESLSGLLRSVTDFAAGEPQYDDQTVLLLSRAEADAAGGASNGAIALSDAGH
jgi:sigma-B regulation protein RsbU (phosphoserine phosphatase)